MPNEIVRDAHIIAQEINYIKERTKREVLRASIEIGFKLNEAKALVAHGEWEKWLEENVNYSQSTANNLMKVAKEYGSDQVDMLTGKVPSDVFAEVSYTKALSLLSLPMDERIEMVESGEVEKMSTRELDEAIRLRKSAEEKSQALEIELGDERTAKEALEERIAELEKDIEKMNVEADAPVQVDMSEYMLRSDADNARLAAVEAARKESAGEIEKVKGEAAKAKEKADKLKAQLEGAEASAAEKVKAEYEGALADAKAKAAELSDKLARAANPAVQRFAIYFEELKEVFDKLLTCVDEAEDGDRQRLRDGVRKVLASMAEVVEV